MATFDAPSREICTLRRISTNTPLQAFVTLNDPVYVEAAQALARRIVREGGSDVEDRAAFGLAAGTGPAAAAGSKSTSWRRCIASELDHYRQDAEAAAADGDRSAWARCPRATTPSELAAWTVVANVILNLDGVLTKR